MGDDLTTYPSPTGWSSKYVLEKGYPGSAILWPGDWIFLTINISILLCLERGLNLLGRYIFLPPLIYWLIDFYNLGDLFGELWALFMCRDNICCFKMVLLKWSQLVTLREFFKALLNKNKCLQNLAFPHRLTVKDCGWKDVFCCKLISRPVNPPTLPNHGKSLELYSLPTSTCCFLACQILSTTKLSRARFGFANVPAEDGRWGLCFPLIWLWWARRCSW